MENNYLNTFIDFAIREDLGDGDHTSIACIPVEATGEAQLLVKDTGVLAGSNIAGIICKKIDPAINIRFLKNDGDLIYPSDVAFIAGGPVRSLLQAERLVLNVMQRMSGIATTTRKYADRLKGLKTRILDTRKTTPGMRMLEKEAVRIGGGVNHRFGLFDMILIKDNHIDFAGSIPNAIHRTHEYLAGTGRKLNIEIEARNLEDVSIILKVGGIHRILLDNFDLAATRTAVGMIGNKYETESSGGITYENIREYAECGVDYISVGALTHHIKSLDLSLKAINYNTDGFGEPAYHL